MPNLSQVMPPDRSGSTGASPEWSGASEWPADEGPEAGRGGETSSSAPGRSTRWAARIRRHREVLVLSLVVLALAFAMVELPGGRVAVRGLTAYPLPPSCATRSLLGIRCPGCGLTRSFIHLAEGDWRASWRCHRLGGLLAAVVMFQVPYRLLALRRSGRPPIPGRWMAVLGGALVALLIANWLADVVTGELTSL